MPSVEEQLEQWRKDLINLGRSNRLLYYRATKTSTLEFAVPEPTTLINRLQRKDQLVFYGSEPTFDPDKESEPGPNHIVSAGVEHKRVRGILRNLERRSSQEFLDRGLWILYVAAGLLEWCVDVAEEQEQALSPILLIPVSLKHESSNEPYVLELAEDDPTINPALATKLEHDFGITLPSIDLYEEEGTQAVLDAVADLVAPQRGWAVKEQAVLSVFSFHKEVMYRDLKDNEERIAGHQAVRAMALGAAAGKTFDFEPIDDSQLDAMAPPEDTATILDADSSQRKCIAAACAGHSFVMDGPPGTGKSQTIANMIVELLAKEKSVLFVSEKAAALDVVFKRLKAAGVSEFCLELHSHKATRKEVAKELGKALTTRVSLSAGFSEGERQRLRKLRNDLTDYAIALNEIRQPLRMSAHEAIGLVSAVRGPAELPPAEGIAIENLSLDDLVLIKDEATRLSGAWGPVARGEAFLWQDLAESSQGVASLKAEAGRRVETARAALSALGPVAADAAGAYALPVPSTHGDLVRLVSLLKHVEKRPAIVPSVWFLAGHLEALQARSRELAAQLQEFHALHGKLDALLGQQWRSELPDAASVVQAATVTLREGEFLFPNEWPVSRVAAFADFTGEWIARLRLITPKVGRLAGLCGLEERSITSERGLEICELGRLAADPDRPDAGWMNPVRLEQLRGGAAALRASVLDCQRRKNNLASTFKDSVFELDLEGLARRFADVHRGIRKLLPAHWRDRKAIKPHTQAGRVNKAVLASLESARDCQRILRRLKHEETLHADLTQTGYYRGLKTDFDRLDRALNNAGRLLSIVGGQLSEVIVGQFSRKGALRPELATLADELKQDLAAWESAAARVGLAEASLGKSGSVPLSDLADRLSAASAPARTVAEKVGTVARLASRDLNLADGLKVFSWRQTSAEIAAAIKRSGPLDEGLFGPLYRAFDTDSPAIDEALAWVSNARAIIGSDVDQVVANRLVSVAVPPDALAAGMGRWEQALTQVLLLFKEEQAARLRSLLSGDSQVASDTLRQLAGSLQDIDEWLEFSAARTALVKNGLGDTLKFCEQQNFDATRIPGLLEQAVLEAWLEELFKTDARLRDWRADRRTSLVKEFITLDRKLIKNAASDMIKVCNGRRPTSAIGVVGIIHREAEKKRRHMPVRTLLGQTAVVIPFLKPCFLMSPLSVSQFLPPDMTFDVVIFDEASQVRPADAIGATYRGRQLIVAGDQKQLPPTSFFEAVTSEGDDEWEEEQLEVFESVLDLCKGSGAFPSLPLRWHYRSQHEDLITFSNYAFYDGSLVTFPSSNRESPDTGVELFRVSGTYRRGGARDNPVEADEVVKRIVYHRRHHPHDSVGVVAFSDAQAQAIEDALERQRDVPELSNLGDRSRLDGLFIKNLETVQGDERDIIIFSVGYARDELGRFTLNFGPLNKVGGERRLNVAITRARRRVEVITSISGADLKGAQSDGLRWLGLYLQYAEARANRLATLLGALGLDVQAAEQRPESIFEEVVGKTMRTWGYNVVYQVGTAGYRIDIGVVDPEHPGRFVLGVECDGAMYHSSRVARDRDRLRQQVLESLGWRLYRVWGPTWYRDRSQAEDNLRRAIEASLRAPAPLAPPEPLDPPKGVQPGTEEVPLFDSMEFSRYAVVRFQAQTGGLMMHDPGAQPELRRLIGAVVKQEGPVHSKVVLRRVCEAWGVQRAGARIRPAFERACRRSGVERESGFLYIPSQRPAHVRVPDPIVPDSYRNVSEVFPGEIDDAIRSVVVEAHAITVEELTQRVANIFGWARRGPDISATLSTALAKLAKKGRVTIDGELIFPGDQPPTVPD